MTRKKTDQTAADQAEADPKNASDTSNGAATAQATPRKRATRSKTTTRATTKAVEQIPEEVTVDFQAVREQLRQSLEWVQEASRAAEEIRDEVGKARARLEETVRDAEKESREVLARVRQVDELARSTRARFTDLEALTGRAGEIEAQIQKVADTVPGVEVRLRTVNEEHRLEADRLLGEMQSQNAASMERMAEIESGIGQLQGSLPRAEERFAEVDRLLADLESRHASMSRRAGEIDSLMDRLAGSIAENEARLQFMYEDHRREAERLLAEIENQHATACAQAEEARTRLGYLTSAAEEERQKAARLVSEIEAQQTVRRTADVPVPGTGVVERPTEDHPVRKVVVADTRLEVEGKPRPDVPAMADAGNPATVMGGEIQPEDAVVSVELVPNEEGTDRENVAVRASIRPESPRARLAHYLQQAISTKGSVANSLQEMSENVIDPGLRVLLREHHTTTVRQQQELARRLIDLGGEPATGKGMLERVLGWFWESRQREPDDLDRSVQNVLKALSAQEFEADMGEALAGLAEALGDLETANLARKQADEKLLAAGALRPFISSLTGLAGHTTEVAHAVRQPMVVEAKVVPVTDDGKPIQKPVGTASEVVQT